MNLGIGEDTFAKLQLTKAEAVDCDSPDGMAMRCPRCDSKRSGRINGWVEYECGASAGVGFVGSDVCFRRAFDTQKKRISALRAAGNAIARHVADDTRGQIARQLVQAWEEAAR